MPPASVETISGTILSDPNYEGVLTVLTEHGDVMQFGVGCARMRTEYGIELEKYDCHPSEYTRRINHFIFKAVKPGGWPNRDENGSADSAQPPPANIPPPPAFLGPIIDAGTLKKPSDGPNAMGRSNIIAADMNTLTVLCALGRHGRNRNTSHLGIKKVESVGYKDMIAMSLLHAHTVRPDDVTAVDIITRSADAMSTGFLEKTIKGMEHTLGYLKEELEGREDKRWSVTDRRNPNWRTNLTCEQRERKFFLHAAVPEKVVSKKRKRDGNEHDAGDVDRERRGVVVVGDEVEL